MRNTLLRTGVIFHKKSRCLSLMDFLMRDFEATNMSLSNMDPSKICISF